MQIKGEIVLGKKTTWDCDLIIMADECASVRFLIFSRLLDPMSCFKTSIALRDYSKDLNKPTKLFVEHLYRVNAFAH